MPNDAPALTPEEIGRILDDFRKANPVIKIDTKDDNREVKVCRKRCGPVSVDMLMQNSSSLSLAV